MGNPLSVLIRESIDARTRRGTLHTPAEIASQCEIWPTTADTVVATRRNIDRLPLRKGILFNGAGSSHLIGLALRPLLQRRLGIDARAIPSTDLLTSWRRELRPDRKGVMVSFSRTGETPETVRVIALAMKHAPALRHLIVTCNRDGAMARKFSDDQRALLLLLPPPTCDHGLAMTTSMTNMTIAGMALAFLRQPSVYRALVAALAQAGKKTLTAMAGEAAALARKHHPRVLLLGSGALHAAAMEGALKILELTDGRTAVMAETFLGVRHGPITFVNDRTLVIALLSNNRVVRRYENDLLRQMARESAGACRLVLTPGNNAIPDDCAVPLAILFPQMYGLFASLAHGLKPDTPSARGVITRVVHGVRIHE